jgi:AcrR family transcriptional regulator
MVSEYSVIDNAGTKRRLQKEGTRAALIEAAFALFAERGPLATTTQAVANAAGVSHGTLFLHFPSQADLVEAVVGEFGSRVNARLHDLSSGGSGVREILEAHLAGLREFEAFYTRLVIEARLLPDGVRITLLGIQSTVSHHLSLAAEREMETGAIRKMPVALLFNTWIALVHYYLGNGDLFAPGESVLEKRGTELIDHFLYLITTPDGEKTEEP